MSKSATSCTLMEYHWQNISNVLYFRSWTWIHLDVRLISATWSPPLSLSSHPRYFQLQTPKSLSQATPRSQCLGVSRAFGLTGTTTLNAILVKCLTKNLRLGTRYARSEYYWGSPQTNRCRSTLNHPYMPRRMHRFFSQTKELASEEILGSESVAFSRLLSL